VIEPKLSVPAAAAGSERPPRCRAAEQRDELAASHVPLAAQFSLLHLACKTRRVKLSANPPRSAAPPPYCFM
jgi:hypothetical protein